MNVTYSLATFVGAVALLSGCGADPENAEVPPNPLEGTWSTAPISPKDADETLRRHGLEKHIEKFRANSPIQPDTVLILHLEDGEWDLYGSYDGGPREEIDYDAEAVITGDEVEVKHADGSNTHRWTIEGDTLKLEWLSGKMAPYEGIPDEVFQRVLYMTEDFTRDESS